MRHGFCSVGYTFGPQSVIGWVPVGYVPGVCIWPDAQEVPFQYEGAVHPPGGGCVVPGAGAVDPAGTTYGAGAVDPAGATYGAAAGSVGATYGAGIGAGVGAGAMYVGAGAVYAPSIG